MGLPDSRAKEPISAVLAGPYAHPLHPILVTLPIGSWVASVVFDVASHLGGPADVLAVGARWLLATGVIGAVAAACVGFLDFLLIPSRTPAHRTAVQHMSLNLVVTAGFTASFAWRVGQSPGPVPAGPLLVSLVCLALLVVSGTLGGRLAYRYGVRVATESVQAEGFEPTGPRDRSKGLAVGRSRTSKGT
jgi:uncharacterized membrane protein